MTRRTDSRVPRTPSHRGERALRWLLAAGMIVSAVSSASAQSAGTAAQTASPGPAAAQPAAKQPPEPPPFRAVVLVTSYGGLDAVSLCFPTGLDHQKARAIVERMAELGGWQTIALEIEDDRFVSVWDQMTEKQPQGQLQTYVDFSAAGVISQKERWIPLDPFIVALREYSPLRLALALGSQVSVEGPGDFEDNTVSIRCNRQPKSVAYDITIKDPNLTSTGVPAHPPALAAPAARAPHAAPGSRGPLLAAVIAALAATMAAALGLALWWKGLWPFAAKNAGGKPAGGLQPPSRKKPG